MHALNYNLRFLITHSVVSLLLVGTIFIVFSLFHFIWINDNSFQHLNVGAFVLSAIMSVYFGLYFASGLQSLKQNYLWTINHHYRNTLMSAYVLALLTVNLIQLPLLLLNIHFSYAILFMPFCISVCISQMVLSKNIFTKILLPYLLIALFQLQQFNISIQNIFLLQVLYSLGIVIAIYVDFLQKGRVQKAQNDTSFKTNTLIQSTGMSFKWLSAMNHFLSRFISQSMAKGPSNIDWVIMMPHAKFAFYSVFYVLIMTFFASMNDQKSAALIGGFGPLFLASYVVNLVMESTHLMKQARTIAHVFNNHRQLKNHILMAFDKVVIINVVVFTIGVLVMIHLLGVSIDRPLLLLTLLVTSGVALAYYPLLMCFNWLNIGWLLLLASMTYALSVFYAIKWLKLYYDQSALVNFLWMFIATCVVLRSITQWLYWQKPLEKLIKP